MIPASYLEINNMQFDLLIKGGEVVDLEAGYNGKMDVAIKRDRIAAVDANIPEDAAFQVIDATGRYITPGLIDFHAHVYEGVTYWGVNADAVGSQSGVTTWVDAGSAGAMTLQGFRDFIVEPSQVKIYAFVNISYIGLVGQNYELSNPEYCNVELLKRIVKLNPDLVVGIKIRAGESGGGTDLVPFERARRAADELGLPIMMHLSTEPPDVETALSYMKPGDIVTHCFTGQSMRMIDENGDLLPAAQEAWERGVIMDLGHGAGSLSFNTAEALTSKGYWPDIVSTDIHHLSIVGSSLMLDDPGKGHVFADRSEAEDAASVSVKVKGEWDPSFSLLTCMDKMLYLGMSFPEVVRATTTRPAEMLDLKGEIGTLKPGARADIAGLVVEDENVELRDIHGEVRYGTQKVRHAMTILDGRPFNPMPIPGPAPWIEPTNKA
jgi:dihydroorotase